MSPKNTLLAALFAIGASVASVAQADAVTHSAPTELGIVTHPEFAGPGRTRAEVAAELAAAQRAPGWDLASRVGERPAAPVGALSRAEVQAQLKEALSQPGWDLAARLGAPMPLAAPGSLRRATAGR